MEFVAGLLHIMDKKDNFGELFSNSLKVGDIIEWSRWNTDADKYDAHYGILLSIKNEVRSNRVVSISRVKPLNEEGLYLEFFTLSLKLVSRADSPKEY